MSEVHNFESFTPAERSYFESRGEKSPIEAETPAIESEDTEAETEEIEADAPETEEKAETKDEPSEEDEKPKKDPGRVPLRKLIAEQEKTKELQKRLAEREEAFARADERLKILLSQFQQPEQPKNELYAPNPQDDPIGTIEYLKQQQERLVQEQTRREHEYRQQQEISAIDTAYKQSWGQFANNNPDALHGYQHFVDVTAQFLKMQGVPDEHINALVENEERKIAVAAMRQGRSPAEMIYEAAKKMGYDTRTVGEISESARERAGTNVDLSKAAKSSADVERRQKAAAASRSLSNIGGTRGSTELTIDELARMPEDEFDAYMSKLSPAKRRRIMGE